MTIKFYNLKINPQNRFYNKIAYENNINDTNVIETIELNREIIPNQVFYLKRDNKSDLVKLMGCTYITYEINGTKFGGFITNIQLLAPKGKTIAVYHSVDWWYFTLLNELSFDMHGNCLRAHVNDIDKDTKYPNMEFTTTSQESPINDFDIDVQMLDLVERSGIKVNGEITNDYTFVYVYFPQITESFLNVSVPFNEEKYYYSKYGIKPSNGFTSVLLLNLNTGYVLPIMPYGISTDDIIQKRLHELSSQYIASISLFDGFVCDTNEYNIITETNNIGMEIAHVSFTNNSYEIGDINTKPESALPKYLSFIRIDNKITHKATLYKSRALFNIYENKEEQTQSSSYDNYLRNGIQKIKYTPYSRCYIGGNEINKYKIPFYGVNSTEGVFTVDLVADLTCFITDFIYTINLPSFSFTNPFIFKPDTVNDYWTKLNARLTANSAKQISLSGTQAILGGIGKISNGLNNIIGGSTKSGIETLDKLTSPKSLPIEAVATISGGASNVANGVNGIIGGGVGIAQGVALKEQASILREIANKQRIDGNISMDNNTGSFLYGFRCCGIQIVEIRPKLGYNSCIYLLTDLHRFGYNTFLQLDEIYKNHQREHFNYFQASDIEITGLPLFIASDLQNMFLSGVHLWTRDIEEFENGTNYQLGLWD